MPKNIIWPAVSAVAFSTIAVLDAVFADGKFAIASGLVAISSSILALRA